MSKLVWDKVGEHFYETGADRGVLYPMVNGGSYPKGVAWSGLISVSENASGAEPNPFYADNEKYLNLISVEDFGLTIEAYTYPDEFAKCDGSAEIVSGVSVGQQVRDAFGFSYRTLEGNDIDGNDYGYKIHLVYNCLAAPSGRDYSSINDSPDPTTFSWEVTTTPVEVPGYKPTASIVIDSTKLNITKLKKLEDILYGTSNSDARLPLPKEIISLVTE